MERSEATRKGATGSEIRVRINGRERDVPPGLSVRALLEFLELDPALVVVEHNRAIVDRARYGEVEVAGGDRLELVHFVGGG